MYILQIATIAGLGIEPPTSREGGNDNYGVAKLALATNRIVR